MEDWGSVGVGGVLTITGGGPSTEVGVLGGAMRGSSFGPLERPRLRPADALGSGSEFEVRGRGVEEGCSSPRPPKLFSSLEPFSELLLERKTSLSRFVDELRFDCDSGNARVRLCLSDDEAESKLSVSSPGRVEDLVGNRDNSEGKPFEVWASGL